MHTAFEINNNKYTVWEVFSLFKVVRSVYLAIYHPVLHDDVVSCMLLFYRCDQSRNVDVEHHREALLQSVRAADLRSEMSITTHAV